MAKQSQCIAWKKQKEEIINELQNIDVMALTPMDAINQLFLLREKALRGDKLIESVNNVLNKVLLS